MLGLVRFRHAALVAIVVVMSVAPATALGHGGQVVIVEPPMVTPGAEVSIHGDFLWTDMPVTITLQRPAAAVLPLAQTTTDGQGHLEARAVMPDVRAGNYTVIVTAESGEAIEVPIEIRAADLTLPIAAVFALLIAGVFALGAWLRRRPVAATPPEASRSPRATAARD